ncbi:hypothetical protein D3C78_1205000 [compost metagenome]
MYTPLAHIDTVKLHITVTGWRITANQHRLFPLIDVGEDRGLLARHPGGRGPQVRGQLQAHIGLRVIVASADLLARRGQRAVFTILEQQADANHVLRFDVVAVLGVGGDHTHQLFRRCCHDIDLDAIGHQFVEQLGLASKDFRRLHLDGLDLITLKIGAWNRLSRGHQLVDIAFELLEGKAGEHLGNPWITDHVVDFAEPVVITEQTFLVLGGVLEWHQLQ